MRRLLVKAITVLVLFTAAMAADAKPITAADSTWFCRYNVGHKALTPPRLRACMAYARRVLYHYDNFNKKIAQTPKTN